MVINARTMTSVGLIRVDGVDILESLSLQILGVGAHPDCSDCAVCCDTGHVLGLGGADALKLEASLALNEGDEALLLAVDHHHGDTGAVGATRSAC